MTFVNCSSQFNANDIEIIFGNKTEKENFKGNCSLKIVNENCLCSKCYMVIAI